ncbi:predicted protein [Nematostella vectensis]|uniref:glutathione-specific gamma-glutamylcyclotransferase n=1 Tax=Nematostella vectensis TaxID=45351 RepID=A7S7S8_NEMVE|nr:glutathione-specific gamma-glutamylcyclotransferase 1 [Nematostella vectensis]EDO40292.1 predicted protein [Nematostella vectensis]|eukprot:XP_001632355.1 predicted protein [Nematostella vectensis]
MIEKKRNTIANDDDEEYSSSDSIWVFGYGSLIWKPDFTYERSVVGHIRGFERKFWQGSVWHRGNEETPGRVVTLEEHLEGQVWGVAYKVSGEDIDTALGRLNKREIALGGYELHNLTFYPQDQSLEPFNALLYAATPENSLYFGKETPEKLALQIVSAHGVSGPNVEYLFRIADFMRSKVPQVEDKHLFAVDKIARQTLGLDDVKIQTWTEIMKNNNASLNRKFVFAL